MHAASGQAGGWAQLAGAGNMHQQGRRCKQLLTS